MSALTMPDPVEPPPVSDPEPQDLTKLSRAELEKLRVDALYRIDWLLDQEEKFGKDIIEPTAALIASDPDAQKELDRQKRLVDDIRAESMRRFHATGVYSDGSSGPPLEPAKPDTPPPTASSPALPTLPEGVAWDSETPGAPPPIDVVPGGYDDGHRFGWKKVVVAGMVAGIAAALGFTLFLMGSSKSGTSAAPPSVTASSEPSSTPSAASSAAAPAATVTITDNEDKFIGGDVCSNGILHLEWDISGGHAGEVVVVDESGPGLPPRRTFRLDAAGHFEVDVHTGGNGEYTTQIVSIGGQPPPEANSTNTATVTGCP